MPISERALRQRAWADKQIAEKWEREAADRPDAPLSAKMFGRDRLLSDHERGSCSPLDGRASEGEMKVPTRDNIVQLRPRIPPEFLLMAHAQLMKEAQEKAKASEKVQDEDEQ